MPESISWSLSAGGTSGSGISATGSVESEAVISVSVDLDAQSGERELDLQVDDVTKVLFLSISSNLLDGSVSAKGTGNAIGMTGPILLMGGAVSLFGNSLDTLTVENSHADKKATVSVLIGLAV